MLETSEFHFVKLQSDKKFRTNLLVAFNWKLKFYTISFWWNFLSFLVLLNFMFFSGKFEAFLAFTFEGSFSCFLNLYKSFQKILFKSIHKSSLPTFPSQFHKICSLAIPTIFIKFTVNQISRTKFHVWKIHPRIHMNIIMNMSKTNDA